MLEGSYPIFKIWMTPKKHIFEALREKALWFIWIERNEKPFYFCEEVLPDSCCDTRKPWKEILWCERERKFARSEVCESKGFGQIHLLPRTDREWKVFSWKKGNPFKLEKWESFFAKRELGGETPTMVFKKYHVVEPTISFFRVRFSNNIRPLSCSPF